MIAASRDGQDAPRTRPIRPPELGTVVIDVAVISVRRCGRATSKMGARTRRAQCYLTGHVLQESRVVFSQQGYRTDLTGFSPNPASARETLPGPNPGFSCAKC